MKSTSKEVQEIRSTFCDNLLQNLDRRFPKESSDITCAFAVLAMRPLTFLSQEEQKAYGNAEIKTLVDFYGKEKKTDEHGSSLPLIEKDACIEEWQLAKHTVLQNKYPRDSMKVLYKILFDSHKDSFPNLLVLAQLALIMPLHTADCERGFSCQNAIKTARRSSLKEDSLNTLMTIKCEGQPVAEHDFGDAVQLWKSKKNRRLLAKQ
ncbi:hypothetical protein BaRGS_00023926 [Batillaria attramentaria]|uniref:HAT C-terminal dimerisation domain-containing protein n=1 Tax=Batillaria attramentaria TaxID=370345 RepID=A0ABD0KCM5_9CAEN